MRRLFIIRKDLNLSPGKLAAMVGHCCEAYWTNLLKGSNIKDNEYETLPCVSPYNPNKHTLYKNTDLDNLSRKAFESGAKTFTALKLYPKKSYTITVEISKDIWDGYVNGLFTKTICEARNLNQLKKAETIANELGLVKSKDYGFINDKCLTELMPENTDGTCTVGIWFRPLPDETAHIISKKFKLYKG